MSALLTADEAARLRPGEQLVIARAGDASSRGPLAPQAWVALTGPCPNEHHRHLTDGHWHDDCLACRQRRRDGGIHCPDCRDGRRIEPLYKECAKCEGRKMVWPVMTSHGIPCSDCRNGVCPSCRGRTHPDESVICAECDDRQKVPTGRVLAGRGSIEVVPVVADAIDIPAIWPQADVLTVDGMGVHLYRWVSHDHWKWQADATLDPLPVPGRDWGIVIDCVEVAP